MLVKARKFDPNIYKNIKGSIIGQQGFKKVGIEVLDDIAKNFASLIGFFSDPFPHISSELSMSFIVASLF